MLQIQRKESSNDLIKIATVFKDLKLYRNCFETLQPATYSYIPKILVCYKCYQSDFIKWYRQYEK